MEDAIAVILCSFSRYRKAVNSEGAGAGAVVPPPPDFLADQLTLIQPGPCRGADYAHHITQGRSLAIQKSVHYYSPPPSNF